MVHMAPGETDTSARLSQRLYPYLSVSQFSPEHFYFFFKYIYCIHAFHLLLLYVFCLHVQNMCAVPMGTRRGHKIPRTGVTDGCELLREPEEPNLESFSKAATAHSY